MWCCRSRWDYVSWSTKVAILRALSYKIQSENNARMVVNSPGFPYIGEMLGLPDPTAQVSSCDLLESLARHEFAIPPILELGACERLLALLEWVWYISCFSTDFHSMWISNQDDDVVLWAIYALVQIAHWLEGAQALVDAKVEDHILKLLKSRSLGVKPETCRLLATLASHESTVPAILELNILKQLVVMTGWVIRSDIYHLVGNTMLKPRVAGRAGGMQPMSSMQLVNGQKVSQLLQTWIYLRSFHISTILTIIYTNSGTILLSTRPKVSLIWLVTEK
jgi:hypothetical protein